MPTTTKNIGQMQLDDFVEGVNGIYSSKDDKRSLWDVWMHANHHASAIGEQVRKGSTSQVLIEIADCAMWLFTMVKKLQGPIGNPKPPSYSQQESVIRIASSYSDMLWKRFPRVCPLCYWRRTAGERHRQQQPGFMAACDCLSHSAGKQTKDEKRLHAIALRAFSQEDIAHRPSGVDEWQRMFGMIFAANLRHLDLTDIALYLLEEMGEVSNALVRMYTYKESDFVDGEPSIRQVWLEEELSNVSSWLFALVEKLDSVRNRADEYQRWLLRDDAFQRDGLLLSQIIWRRYGSDEHQSFVCWKCGEQSCTCQIILVPPDRSVEDLRGLIDSGKKL